MINELFVKCKYILVESVKKLKGSDKRKALAETAKTVGKGGQSIVASQFVKRVMEFVVKYDITVVLAYYPPYHSKHNPIKRVWGSLEKHWNGLL
jgi:hypothetical protein